MLLHHLLTEGASCFPDQTAFGWVKRDRMLSYAEAADATGRVAASLVALGIERGDRVGIFAHSGMDYLLAMFGAWRAGAVAALVDLRHAQELDRYFGDCQPKVVIYTHDYFETIDRHRAALAHVETYVCLDGAQPGALDWAELLGGSQSPPADATTDGDLVQLYYTADPEGRPVGACLSHETAYRAGSAIAARAGLHSDDVSLGPTALSAPYQLVANVVPALTVGGTCWVMNNWDAEGGLEVVERIGATVLAANPPVLASALTEAAGRSGGVPTSLRLVLSGEGRVPADLARGWSEDLGLAPTQVQLPQAEPWPVSAAP